MQILGLAGRAKILKEVMKTLKMPEEIIPEEQIDAMDIAQGGAPVPGQDGGMPGQPGQPGVMPAQPGEGLPNGNIPGQVPNPGSPGGVPGGALPPLADPGRI
jgi:hypothetical protein